MTAANPAADRPLRRAGPETRTLREDLEWLRDRVESAIAARPLTATATAAGIGFVLGGGLAGPTLGVLIQTGSRVAANWLGEAIRHRDLHETAEEDRG